MKFVIKGGGWLWIAEKGPEFEPFPSDREAALPVGSDDLILGVTKTVLSDLLIHDVMPRTMKTPMKTLCLFFGTYAFMVIAVQEYAILMCYDTAS